MSEILRLADFIPYRLSYTSNLVSGRIAQAYDALFGLKIPEWRVLAVVAERDGITQQEIGHLTGMDKVVVSRAAIALTTRKLLVRTANDADRRSRLVVLSREGRELYEQVVPKARQLEKRALSGLSAEEVALLVSILERIDRATTAGD